MNKASGSRLQTLFRNGDYFLAIALFAVIMLLVLPLPKLGLDMLLAMNIAGSLLILLVIIYVKEPVQFSVFPTLLLVITLYRLSLNIASTRLILLEGDAGKIIRSFGEFVVGGNYVVGGVIFLILVLVNFIVITKGSGRIAEVAARFTLDAMPGKQMAIDAELNAGAIDEKVATKRRNKIQQESDFYGKMDGASKFVRGDAIAGLLITLINVIGGFAIGVMQKGMAFDDAARHYSLLSIGDGLVSQIPALVVSVAAGLLVTRTAGSQNLGSSFARQLASYPRALAILAGLLGFFALLPGMPKIPFVLLGVLAGFAALTMMKVQENRSEFADMLEDADGDDEAMAGAASSAAGKGSDGAGNQQAANTPAPASKEELQKLADVEPLAIELGYSLLDLADSKRGGDLLDRVTGIRKSLAREMGLVLPPIAVRDNLEMETNGYSFLMRGRIIAKGTLHANRWLAMNVAGSSIQIRGEQTREPVFNLEATWVDEENRKIAELHGYTVVDSASVLITHLSEVLRQNCSQLLSRQDVQGMLDHVKTSHPSLINELIPDLANLGLIQRVLQNLLLEQVPIKHLAVILECIADFAPHSKNPDDLSEQARRRLAPFFVPELSDEQGALNAVTLDPRLEQNLVSRIQRSNFEVGLSIDPQTAHNTLNELNRLMTEMTENNLPPVILTVADLRLPFKRFFESSLPRMTVLSYQEIPSNIEIRHFGVATAPVPSSSKATTSADKPATAGTPS